MQHSTKSTYEAILHFNYTFNILVICSSDRCFWEVDHCLTQPKHTLLFLQEMKALEKKKKSDNSVSSVSGIIVTFLLFNFKRKQCLFCSGQLFKVPAVRIFSTWADLGLFKNDYCIALSLLLLLILEHPNVHTQHSN